VGTTSDVAPQPFAGCSPPAAEICNGQDDDCNGSTDENAVCANRCQAAAIIGQCAIRGDGRLVCWSQNGLPISPDDPAVQAHVSQFVTAPFADCVRRDDGGVWCRDRPGRGPTFARVRTLGWDTVEIALGHVGACARKTDGSVWCWSPIGTSPSFSYGTPQRVPALQGALHLFSAERQVCAAMPNGSLWCAGIDVYDRSLSNGDGPPTWKVKTGVSHVAKLQDSGEHTCALRDDGRIFCRGGNNVGQLGDGTLSAQTQFVSANALGDDNVDLAIRFDETCALKRDGSVVCVGDPTAFIQPSAGANGSQPHALTAFGPGVRRLGFPCAMASDGSVRCLPEVPRTPEPMATQVEVCSAAERTP
jgi:hypothetical protein